MPTIFWDCETRSVINLRDSGAQVYARDPTTTMICLGWAVDEGNVQVWRPGEEPPAAFLAAADNPTAWTLVSDNWTFERAVLEHVLVPRHGFRPIPLEVHACAERLALANSYPAELGLRAQALGLPYRKDPEARKAMLAISRPRKQGKRGKGPLWNEDPDKIALVLARCKLDVITTRACWQAPQLKHLSATERRYLLLDATINDRGVRADVQFLSAARDLAIRERTAINLKLAELTDGVITTVDQVKRFLAAINARGHRMTTMSKRAVAEVLANKPNDYVTQLLTLRRTGARASVQKYKRMLAYAGADHRLRGTLRIYGAGPGRWSGLGPQLQNLKKNESKLPLSVVDAVRNGDRSEIARYGNPLALLGDISRAALCAAPGHMLLCADYATIESRILAWLAGEQWKLTGYAEFDISGDKARDVYRIVAHRMLRKNSPVNEITAEERQLGKCAELAAGFGGSVGAWRRIVGHDPRSDAEITASIQQWRDSHPATRQFWKDLARAIRITMRTGQPILVAPAPRPSIVATFTDGILRLTLPSGRAITYPGARLVPGKFEDAPADVEFMDNAKGQWKPYRGWFGTFVENCVQGIARDLLAAAIERCENCGLPVAFHCHDETIVEAPIGAISEAAFLAIMLERPPWAEGLPLGGKVHSGPHYLEPPETPAEPLPVANSDHELVEAAVDAYLEEDREHEITDPVALERDDEKDFLTQLDVDIAPLTDLVSLSMDSSNRVSCPFHEDPNPSCKIYPDHYHCFGCGEHGNRLDWLMRVEGMTQAEAVAAISDWDGPRPPPNCTENTDKVALALQLWSDSQSIRGTVAERYLHVTRCIARLPSAVHDSLRFHPACPFGRERLPCLVALMRDPLNDVPIGIQRTALTLRGEQVEKIDRRMLGHAGVVKLWPLGTATQLAVGEGLETTLSAMILSARLGEDLRPAWAALSSGMLGALPVIPQVSRLTLFVDNDANGQGQTSAARCDDRWTRAGRTVVHLTPEQPSFDFNDLILSEVSP
jgi:DNA polymerase bacteriophage-type